MQIIICGFEEGQCRVKVHKDSYSQFPEIPGSCSYDR